VGSHLSAGNSKYPAKKRGETLNGSIRRVKRWNATSSDPPYKAAATHCAHYAVSSSSPDATKLPWRVSARGAAKWRRNINKSGELAST